MCRLAAYLGPDISLGRFLLEPAHGLVPQSWRPREMREGSVNADGYGFGWFDAHGAPARFVNVLPIWSDTNLAALGRSLHSRLWVGNVRSATPGASISPADTQPFADDEFLFLHNGLVGNFAGGLRRRLRDALAPEIEARVHGHSDSEHLFALLRHILASDAEMPVEEGLIELFGALRDWLGDEKALLNIVVADSERVYATRYAINGECPSLYFTTDDEAYPDGLLVASEPLTASPLWQSVPENHLLVLDPREPPDLLAL